MVICAFISGFLTLSFRLGTGNPKIQMAECGFNAKPIEIGRFLIYIDHAQGGSLMAAGESPDFKGEYSVCKYCQGLPHLSYLQ